MSIRKTDITSLKSTLECKRAPIWVESCDNANPHCSQVEHTITEEITGIDIVAAQIQIAAGASLQQLGLTQDRISTRGFAVQCRITTEDPAKGFSPDTGKIEVYRSAGGNGVRLDGGNGFAGAVITPHYDSMLVKCTCHGSTYEIARRKMLRALVEFRIRGVKTNIPFLASLLSHPTFIEGTCWTTFIDDTCVALSHVAGFLTDILQSRAL